MGTRRIFLHLRRWSGIVALISVAAVASSCGSASPSDTEKDAAAPVPGPADDFSWYWDEVTAVQGKTNTYSIEVRFTNISDRSSPLPDCWAVGGRGRVARLLWDERPLVEAGKTISRQGIASFRRGILEIDEVVCDAEVAASYRH